MAYLWLTLAFGLNAFANILLKLGANKGLVLGNWQLLGGLFFFAINVVFYFLALRALPLSVAYPIMVAMSFLLINGYAFLTLGEPVTPLQIVGYVLIIGGLVLVVSQGS